MSKSDIQKSFAALLKLKHTAKRVRSKTKWASSTAKYTINRNYSIDSLRTALTVYDAYIANSKLPKKTAKDIVANWRRFTSSADSYAKRQ